MPDYSTLAQKLARLQQITTILINRQELPEDDEDFPFLLNDVDSAIAGLEGHVSDSNTTGAGNASGTTRAIMRQPLMPISANLPDAHSFKPPKARKRSIEVSNEDDGPTSRQQSQQKLARIDAEDQILVRGLNQLACLFRAFNQYACREDSEQVLVTALWQAAESVLIGVGRIYDELEARRSVKRPGRKAHVWTLYFRNLPIAFFQERIAHELAALIKRSTFTPQLAPPPHLVARLRELGEYLRLSFRYGRLDKHVKEQIEEWKETEGRAIEDFGLWDPESKGKRRRRN